jgi:hypothetical protein
MLFLPIAFDILTYFIPDMNSYKGSWWFYLSFSVMYLKAHVEKRSNKDTGQHFVI